MLPGQTSSPESDDATGLRSPVSGDGKHSSEFGCGEKTSSLRKSSYSQALKLHIELLRLHLVPRLQLEIGKKCYSSQQRRKLHSEHKSERCLKGCEGLGVTPRSKKTSTEHYNNHSPNQSHPLPFTISNPADSHTLSCFCYCNGVNHQSHTRTYAHTPRGNANLPSGVANIVVLALCQA